MLSHVVFTSGPFKKYVLSKGVKAKRTSIDFMTSFESVQGEGGGGLKITKFECTCFLNGPIYKVFEKRQSAKLNPREKSKFRGRNHPPEI